MPAALQILFTDSLAGVEAQHLTGFFVGWPQPPDAAALLRILRGSSHVWLARELDSGRVLGFITALSDGVLAAFIPLLEVLPDYQGQGIGTQLVQRMLATLTPLYSVDLVCDDDLAPFYERLGLRRMLAMSQRRYVNQSGAPAAPVPEH